MRRPSTINIFFKLLLILIVLTGSLTAKVLIVPVVRQEQNQWCWAAVSSAVLLYYGKYYPQCEIADYTRLVCSWHNFGPVDCCTDASQGCNYWNYMYGTPGSLNDILDHFGINNIPILNYLTLVSAANEINNNRPFIIRWGWTGGGGHFLVGQGIANNTMNYMDPWQGEGFKTSTYDWVKQGADHTWTHTIKITTNAKNVVIVLSASRDVEKAWIIKRAYGIVNFKVQNNSSAVIASFSILRKTTGGQYQEVGNIPADAADNTYTYYDKFIDEDTTYYYKVQALNSAGVKISASNYYPLED